MATITIKKQNLDIEINSKKFYRIIEIDFEKNKKVVSHIFKGENGNTHLPEPMNGYIYQIQRMKCLPGKHELNTEQKV